MTVPELKHTLPINVEMTNGEIAKLLSGLSNDDLIEIIKEIDELVEQWDFTLDLATHFEKLRLDFIDEYPELNDEETMVRGLVDEDVSDA